MSLASPAAARRSACWSPRRWSSAPCWLPRRRSAALAAAGHLRAGPAQRTTLGLWLSLGGRRRCWRSRWPGRPPSLPVGRSAGTVILAMDVSNSMSANDVAPSRLAAAQQAAGAFIDAQPDTVDIGVVGFDQGALTTSLPSADRAAAKAAVADLRPPAGPRWPRRSSAR